MLLGLGKKTVFMIEQVHFDGVDYKMGINKTESCFAFLNLPLSVICVYDRTIQNISTILFYHLEDFSP